MDDKGELTTQTSETSLNLFYLSKIRKEDTLYLKTCVCGKEQPEQRVVLCKSAHCPSLTLSHSHKTINKVSRQHSCQSALWCVEHTNQQSDKRRGVNTYAWCVHSFRKDWFIRLPRLAGPYTHTHTHLKVFKQSPTIFNSLPLPFTCTFQTIFCL